MSVESNYPEMTTPQSELAIGLLIAMVAGVVVTLVVGTARITQVRRLARRHRRSWPRAG
jgi:uncharacterized integral membrane protein